MRGKKAKRLRRMIYGEMAHETREYVRIPFRWMGGGITSYQIINAPTSLRAKYLAAKRVAK